MAAERALQLDLDYVLAPHMLGPVYVGSREIVRLIPVTVRDAEWQKIAPHAAEVDRSDQHHLRFQAGYASPLNDFEWLGTPEMRDVA